MKIIIGFIIIALFFTACSKSDSKNNNTNPTPTTTNISIVGMTYNPATVSVAKGTIVKWTNTDMSPHTATSDDGTTFNSGNISAGSSYSYTTTTAGTFPYHCLVHGTMMSGTLTVTP